MSNIKRIKAFLNLDQSKVEIGEMIEKEGKIYFKYHSNYVTNGLEISPFKMKLSNEILTPKEQHFDGLFGVFSDSIPDGWGKLLVDRNSISNFENSAKNLGLSKDSIKQIKKNIHI